MLNGLTTVSVQSVNVCVQGNVLDQIYDSDVGSTTVRVVTFVLKSDHKAVRL